MQRYPILHSGFIAQLDTHFTKTEYLANPFVENVLFLKSGNNTYANLFYSEEVTTMFKQYQTNRDVMGDFEFRERILKVAALMFGKSGINDWLEIQNKYAKVSYSHLEFIIDTIKYIYLGQRDYSLGIWENVIRNDHKGSNNLFEDSEQLRAALKEGRKVLEGYLAPTLNEWVSHVGGYSDLLYTLYLIFGNKSYALHMTNQKPGV